MHMPAGIVAVTALLIGLQVVAVAQHGHPVRNLRMVPGWRKLAWN